MHMGGLSEAPGGDHCRRGQGEKKRDQQQNLGETQTLGA